MRRTDLVVGLVGTAALLAGGLAEAHHSGAMFDATKVITLNGTVKEFQYTQPHTWLVVLVPNATTSQLDVWRIEMQAPSLLAMIGIDRETFHAGDKVSVDAHPLKDGRTAGELVTAVTADGKRVGGFGGGPPRTTNQPGAGGAGAAGGAPAAAGPTPQPK